MTGLFSIILLMAGCTYACLRIGDFVNDKTGIIHVKQHQFKKFSRWEKTFVTFSTLICYTLGGWIGDWAFNIMKDNSRCKK